MTGDITSWLAALGLSQYAQAFVENGVDLDLLPEITNEDLKDLGVHRLADRKRILRSIAQQSIAVRQPSSEVRAPERPVTVATSEPERRRLTVMFCDLVGSTALSTRLDPEDYRQVIRTYQDACAGVITRYDGYVAKFMGDGILAYFGWPRSHEDDAERAISAALGLIDALCGIGPADGATEPLAVRIGVATGPVVVGDIVGEGAAQEAAVTGETPNLAARLQAIARPNTVVIAEATQALASGLFTYESLGESSLKGIADPVQAFRVTGERPVESRFEARRHAVLPMVGRDQELALLLERWAQVKSGEGQGVLLVGEAGIGKSRIVRSLYDVLSDEPHTRLRYQCSPFHTDSAFWPVIQQLSHAAGFRAEDGGELRLDKLEALLAQAQGLNSHAPLIADLLGLSGIGRYEPLDLTPQARRARTLETLVRQMTGLAARQPVLATFEDAHWIDPTTLEMVEHCLDTVADAPVLMLITTRPDNQPQIAGHPHVTRLTLNRLSRAGVETIVARLGGKDLPRDAIDAIIARTDGVPLFVEELTKALLETGETTIPASLHDTLMARLDRIPEVKEVAQVAACIGREFDFALLARIMDQREPDLASALDRLAAAELIFRRGAPSAGSYLFKHALVRDAAYESILKRRREAIHGQLVEVLESQPSTTPEVLARHSEAAGLTEKAVEHWHRAGAQAIERPAYREAITGFNAAIRLCNVLGDEPAWQRRELQLQLELGQALIANLGYQAPATMATFERALGLAEAINERELLVPAIFGLWASRYIAALPSASLADRMFELVAHSDDDGARCVSARMLALERFHAGRYRPSLELVEQALSIYDRERHRDLALRYAHDPCVAATNYKAWNLWHLGYPDQARDVADSALAWACEINHANTIGLARCYGIALTNILLGDVDRVLANAQETLKLAEEKSLALWGAWARIHLGWALSQNGLAEGLDELQRGLSASQEIGARRIEPFHLGLAADCSSRWDRHDDANRLFAAAFAALAESGDIPFAADLHRLRALASLRASSGGKADALSHLERAVEIARDQEALSLELRAARDLARIWAENGERRKAHDYLAPVRSRFHEGDATQDLRETDTLLAELK